MKKFRESVWCKAVCAVLAVVLAACLAAEAAFAVIGLSYPFSADEKAFFNSERVVLTLTSRLENLAIAAFNHTDNKAVYDELLAQEDAVVDSIKEEYKKAKADYELYYHTDYYDDYDEEGEAQATAVYSDSYFDTLELTAEVSTSRGDYTFRLPFVQTLYEEEGATTQQVLHNAYRSFAYESAYGTEGEYYYGGFTSTASMTHSIYQNDAAIEVGTDGVMLDEKEQRTAIDFYDNGEYVYAEELQTALDGGYYFIWDNGTVTYDEAVFTPETAAALTKACETQLADHDGITYILYLNYNSLLRCASDGHYNLAMLVSGDDIVSYWMLEQASWNSGLVRTLTSSRGGAAVLLGVTFLLTAALAVFYLTVTGKKKPDGTVKLCFKDYVPFEVHFLVDFALGCIPLGLFLDGSGVTTALSLYTPIGAAVCALILAALALGFAASVVRAVKSERRTANFFLAVLIWKGIVRVFRSLKRALGYKPKCFKRNVVLIAVGYVLLSAFLIVMTGVFWHHGYTVFFGFCTLVSWLGLNGVAIYFLSDYVGKLDEMIINTANRTEVDNIERLYPSLQYLAKSTKYQNAQLQQAIDKAVRDERLRTELITNVSHDLKTPLTSIITYVDLLSKCDISDEQAQQYIKVLDEKGARLKRLIDDLIEASKVTSGVITVVPERLSLNELCMQATVEAQEGFDKADVALVVKTAAQSVEIIADGQKTFRVMENLLSNARKYSAAGSRAYVSVTKENGWGVFEIKNISAKPLDISPEELTQRFVRGDASRSQEGNGLGLSIAKELCRAQGGSLELSIDGDLFKARVCLPLAE